MAAWAEARPTQTVQLLADLAHERAQRFADELAARDILIELGPLLDAQGEGSLAAYHRRWGYKAEFLPVRSGGELRRSALARRQPVDLGAPLGLVSVLAPEDLILDKLLEFSRRYQAEHARDVVALIFARRTGLDADYLARWTDSLGLVAIWRYVCGLARPIG